MGRTWLLRSLVAAIVFAAHGIGWHGPAHGQGPVNKPDAALKERDRLWKESQEFRAEGKTAEAIASAEAMLAIEQKVLPVNYPDLAGSLGWLADLHLAREEFAAARSARREAFRILRKVHGAAHWKVTDARMALAHVDRIAGLNDAQRQRLVRANQFNRSMVSLHRSGKTRDAIILAREVLAICTEVLGEQHPETASSLNNLGLLLQSQGDYAGARTLYEQALAIQKQVLGERHPNTAESLNNLAILLQSRGDYAGAKPLLEQALTIDKEALGERHNATASRLNNLAALLLSEGDYAAARLLFEQALAICKEVLGERHPNTATCLNNLAFLLQSQGDHAAARPLLEQALAIQKEVLGERHPDTATTMTNLALLLRSRGDYTAAKPLLEQALAIRKEMLGERHPDTATSLNDLAALLLSQGDFAVWEPVEPHLDGVTTVLVSPDGVLGLVPLGALPGKANERYLIEEYTIALVPVPQMFGAGHRAGEGNPQAEPPSLLLLGDVDYGGEPGRNSTQVASRSAAVSDRAGLLPDFGHLDATRGEILQVRDSFEERFPDAPSPLSLRAARATEETLRQEAPKRRFLHLATHGYFAPESLKSALDQPTGAKDQAGRLATMTLSGYHPGLLSGLALTGANVRPTPMGKDDGILTALEVAELDLSKVELAVLSACETGLGQVAGGEGLLGLQRAFQVAGAGSVVASLWTVPDTATMHLMARFYEHLWKEGRPPHEALRLAQLEMLQHGYERGGAPLDKQASATRVPPYYWAAFVLSTNRL